jgi:hypothetical protein
MDNNYELSKTGFTTIKSNLILWVAFFFINGVIGVHIEEHVQGLII